MLEILQEHGASSPDQLLFLWNLFEGVPKFYRDCYEQGVLESSRPDLIRRLFFESSSPLRYEAEHWFLKELRGRYDVVLKFVARNPGCSNADIENHVQRASPDTHEQVAGYLKILSDRYRMIERKLPIFSKPKARRGRYYISDNFLQSWLAAFTNQMSAVNFRPLSELVRESNDRLMEVEGHGLEKLVGVLYEERSRKGRGDFPLTHQIQGYWDKGDTEIDLSRIP